MLCKLSTAQIPGDRAKINLIHGIHVQYEAQGHVRRVPSVVELKSGLIRDGSHTIRVPTYTLERELPAIILHHSCWYADAKVGSKSNRSSKWEYPQLTFVGLQSIRDPEKRSGNHKRSLSNHSAHHRW